MESFEEVFLNVMKCGSVALVWSNTIIAKILLRYCDLMVDGSTKVPFPQKEWKTVQSLANTQPVFLVFLYAYHMLVDKDVKKAETYLEKFYKLKKTYHLPVEYITEERNLALLKKKVQGSTVS